MVTLAFAEISSALRRNCMKWKAARQQVLKISVEWLKRSEESSERSWNPSAYEARGCSTLCRLIVWWLDLHILRSVWVYYWILICVGALDLRWDVCGFVFVGLLLLHITGPMSMFCTERMVEMFSFELSCIYHGRYWFKSHLPELNYITDTPDTPQWTLLA